MEKTSVLVQKSAVCSGTKGGGYDEEVVVIMVRLAMTSSDM